MLWRSGLFFIVQGYNRCIGKMLAISRVSEYRFLAS